VTWLVKQDHPVEEQPARLDQVSDAQRAAFLKTVPTGLLNDLRAQIIEEYKSDMQRLDEAGDRLTTEGDT